VNKQLAGFKNMLEGDIERHVELAIRNQASFGQGSRDPSKNPDEYHKILELMLDLERKTDGKFKDTQANFNE
jgi:hypothetical protein